MPVVVFCPACGAKLQAPENKIGKKAKCSKCHTSIRIPGPVPSGETTPPPTAGTIPVSAEDEATEVMMAEPVDDDSTIPVAAPVPTPAPSSIPTAVPAAEAKPAKEAVAKPAKEKDKPAKEKEATAKPAKEVAEKPAKEKDKDVARPAKENDAEAKPAKDKEAVAKSAKDVKEAEELPSNPFDFSKLETPAAPAKSNSNPPKATPAKPEPATPVPVAKAKPAAPAAAPATLAATPAPAKTASKTAAEALPAVAPVPAAKPKATESATADPFARIESPSTDEKPAKSKKRREDEEEKEKETSTKRRDDKNDKDEEPSKKDEDESHEHKAASGADEPYNPFANYESGTGEQPAFENPWDDKKSKKKGDKNPKDKKKKGDRDEDDEGAKPRYVQPQKGKMGLIIAGTAVIGLIALGLGIAALVVFTKQQRDAAQARLEKEKEKEREKEKKEEPPAEPGGPANPPADPKQKEPEPKPPEKNPDPKQKDLNPKEKNPESGRPLVSFTKLKTFTVGTPNAKAELADKPPKGGVMDLTLPSGTIRRVFPPAKLGTDDTVVLVQSAPAVNGVGEKLAIEFFGPAGNRVLGDRVEYPGDDVTTPIADYTIKDKKAYFLAKIDGKLHVWSISDKSKIADGINPYAEKPEHEKFGLAAAFFSPDPNRVVLVSSAGTVLLYDLTTKKAVNERILPNGTIGRVSLGRSVVKAEGGASIGLAVAGVLYQVKADPTLEVMRKYDLGGDVDRSIGLALSGTPGRILYVCETTVDGKKEKVAMGLQLGDEAKPIIYRFPSATVGDPKGVLWADDTFGGVVTERGVVWFVDHEKKFLPILMTQPTAPGQYFGDDKYFWYVMPNPKKEKDKSSILVALSPFEGFPDYVKISEANQPLKAARIDEKGLSK